MPTELLSDLLALVKGLSFYGLNLVNTDQLVPLKPNLVLMDSRTTSDNNTCNSDWNDDGKSPIETKKKRFTKKPNQGRASATNKNANESTNGNIKPVPLIKYTDSSSRIKKSNQGTTSESDVSDIDSAQPSNSKFFIDKCSAKVRVAALSVLETAFEV